MPQYSNNQTTEKGAVVSAVFDTEANIITYTVTTASGLTATITAPPGPDGSGSEASSVSNLNSIRDQITAANGGDRIAALSSLSGFGSALRIASGSVQQQAKQAQATSTATNTPVPDNPTPPPPVTASTDPNPVPNTTTSTESVTSPGTVTENVFDPTGNNGAPAVEENVFNPKQDIQENVFEPGTTFNAGEENVFNPKQDIEENVFNPGQTINAGEENVFNPQAPGGNTGALSNTQSTATNQDAVSFEKAKDWRVRLSLAPNANYLYKASNPGILQPLAATNGVVFPYTPSVNVVYAASYDASELIHSNYKIYNYKSSSVDTVNITCDFTAQDTTEANYLMAVIHFFRSVTKMFYGRDENPRNGVPPPLCYLSGFGTFQFDNHPLVVTNFTYTLPTEVDYIRVGSQTNVSGNPTNQQIPPTNTNSPQMSRIQSSNLGPKVPNFQRQAATINSNATYVPTKMQIAITCIPIVTRNDISNRFSLKDYATGALLQGSKNNGGGIW